MEQTASFRFLEHKIIESSIKFDPSKDAKELHMNIESQAQDNEKDHKMRLLLTVTVNDDEKIMEIKATACAYFEYEEGMNPEFKESFFKCNAPAIVFPFLRAYINSLTALSGIKPVVLPTINFSSAK